MTKQTTIEWLQYLYGNRPESDLLEQDFEQAKQMEKEQIRKALILFCNTEAYGACDIRSWVKTNGIRFKARDTEGQIVDRVDCFVINILNKIYEK